ncbi:MAG: acyltransferase [Actinomycetota bacterium]|nr:acyltransferase [Actinomycetota bacterium]
MQPIGPVDVAWFAALLVCGVAWFVSARAAAGARSARGAPRSPVPTGARRGEGVEHPTRVGGLPVLGQVLDPRANGLNALRLVLASSVLLWHSYPLTGRHFRAGPVTDQLAHLLADGPVDGFFALSGFLIAGSWVRRPELAAFVRSRVLRILPAYLVCLTVTAAAVAPLGLLLAGQRVAPLTYLRSAVTYVLSNAGLALFQVDIAGTPSAVPYPGAWNGSIWTLQWEVGCYLGVLLLGVLGLLRRPLTSVVVFVVATGLSVIVALGVLPGVAPTELARLTTMFTAGMLLFALRDRIPVSPLLVGVAAMAFLACLWLPSYRVPGALLLAYAILGLGACLRAPRWHLHDDISYGVYIYAFPVQQLLALTALVRAPLPIFVLVVATVTFPLAVASWFLVEKPLLRRRHRPGAVVPLEPVGPVDPFTRGRSAGGGGV